MNNHTRKDGTPYFFSACFSCTCYRFIVSGKSNGGWCHYLLALVPALFHQLNAAGKRPMNRTSPGKSLPSYRGRQGYTRLSRESRISWWSVFSAGVKMDYHTSAEHGVAHRKLSWYQLLSQLGILKTCYFVQGWYTALLYFVLLWLYNELMVY